jgi:hypothetical protein
MFENFRKESLRLRKKSNGHVHDFQGIVMPAKSQIVTDFVRLPVEDGDLIERPTPMVLEIYSVLDRGYYSGFEGVPAHFQMKVQKSAAELGQPRPAGPATLVPNLSDDNRHVIAALRLLHPAFRDYAHYFREGKLPEAIAAAFERYENRLNEIRDGSNNPQIMASSGHPLVYKLFDAGILKEPYPKLGSSPAAKQAYEKGLTGVMSGGVTWFRNSRTHEKHNLPAPTPEEALELLFVASYLMRMLDLSCR